MLERSATDVEILDLADAPDLVDTCAAWSFGTWGCQSGGSLARSRAGFARAAGQVDLNVTFVARQGGKPAGMASLRASDFVGRPDLSPWLASVNVHPDHRRIGLARSLVRRVEDRARERDCLRLYLISEHAQALYGELGWSTFDHVVGPHGPAVLMTKALTRR